MFLLLLVVSFALMVGYILLAEFILGRRRFRIPERPSDELERSEPNSGSA